MIYFVRHGQTNWNLEHKTQGWTDIPLNENGKIEAKKVSNIFKNIKIDKIYSSDLSRAKKTAEIIKQNYNLDIIIDERLREIKYGDLEGLRISKLDQNTWDIINNNPKKLNAEGYDEVYNRIVDFFKQINKNENILIVTHAGIIRILLYFVKNNIFKKEEFDKNYRHLKIQNVAIYRWNIEDNKLEIIE